MQASPRTVTWTARSPATEFDSAARCRSKAYDWCTRSTASSPATACQGMWIWANTARRNGRRGEERDVARATLARRGVYRQRAAERLSTRIPGRQRRRPVRAELLSAAGPQHDGVGAGMVARRQIDRRRHAGPHLEKRPG